MIQIRDFICLFVFSCIICFYGFVRENSHLEPIIFMNMFAYFVTFIVIVFIKKIRNKITKEDIEIWDPTIDRIKFLKVIGISLLLSINILCEKVLRTYSFSFKNSLSVNIWLCSVPFFLSIFRKRHGKTEIVTSVAVSLALVCSSVLMLSIDDFGFNIKNDLISIVKSFSLAIIFDILNELLTKNVTKIDTFSMFLDLIMNITIIVPFLLFIITCFTETSLVLYIASFDMSSLLLGISRIAFTNVFCIILLIFTSKSDNIVFFSTAFAIANTFTIALSNSILSLFGMFMVFLSTLIYAKLLNSNIKNLDIQDFEMMTINNK